MLLSPEKPQINVGVETVPVQASVETIAVGEEDKPIDSQLQTFEKYKLLEKKQELEIKKQELQHFYGSKAFQLMKNLSNHVVDKYLNSKGKKLETPHFPWIKEYKRFVEK